MGEVKKQTVSGVKWLIGASFMQRFISLTTIVVLARVDLAGLVLIKLKKIINPNSNEYLLSL